MKEKKGHKYKRRLGVVTTVLLVVLIIYFATQIFGKMNTTMSVINTQTVTDRSFISLNGYVYRNEELITVGTDEVADFLVGNGERVPVGKRYMTVYKTSVSGEDERASVQKELDALNERINLLNDGINNNPRVQDIDSVRASFSGSYYSYLSSVADGSYSSADSFGSDMLDYLNQQQMITGKLDTIKSSVESIEQSKSELISKYSTGSATSMTSIRSCYIYSGYDGYEAAFSYADAMTLSADELREKITGAERENITNAVGKRVYDSKWYLVVPVTQASFNLFSVGSTVEVQLTEAGDESIPMNVERLESLSNGASGYAVLSSSEIGKSFGISRYTSIKVERSSVSGYRVPDEAIHSLDHDNDGYSDFTGVYVMSGNYVKFRRINVLSYGNGYVIAGGGEEDDIEFPYLSGSELIIVSGGNLYDGKLIK